MLPLLLGWGTRVLKRAVSLKLPGSFSQAVPGPFPEHLARRRQLLPLRRHFRLMPRLWRRSFRPLWLLPWMWRGTRSSEWVPVGDSGDADGDGEGLGTFHWASQGNSIPLRLHAAQCSTPWNNPWTLRTLLSNSQARLIERSQFLPHILQLLHHWAERHRCWPGTPAAIPCQVSLSTTPVTLQSVPRRLRAGHGAAVAGLATGAPADAAPAMPGVAARLASGVSARDAPAVRRAARTGLSTVPPARTELGAGCSFRSACIFCSEGNDHPLSPVCHRTSCARHSCASAGGTCCCSACPCCSVGFVAGG
jgi:hypothetical protein